MEQETSQPCGCSHVIDGASGVKKSVAKCDFHRAHQGKCGEQHYIEMGCIVDGIPQHRKYYAELCGILFDLIGSGIPAVKRKSCLALEIGCGLAMYAPALLDLGYSYIGIDSDPWAYSWVRNTLMVPVFNGKFEEFHDTKKYDLIIAAHVFEHLENGPGGIAKAVGLLKPGGMMIIVVPDDTDLANPDHLWFFTEQTLRSTMETAGLYNIRMVSKQVVQHEKFMYAVATI